MKKKDSTKNTVFLSLVLPEKFSLNKLYTTYHWSKRNQLKDMYHLAVLQYRNKYVLTKFPVSIRYTYHFKTRPLDTINCSGMSKVLEDGLRSIGLLPDDTMKYVKETTIIVEKTDQTDYVDIYISPIK